jgi:hypothetical protein
LLGKGAAAPTLSSMALVRKTSASNRGSWFFLTNMLGLYPSDIQRAAFKL